ncbi:hypothetical protein [Serratia fonticola]|uniref:hypothetical protein n=1 Tax=Serratia fonticola TaxID=47917 RepID=UPI0021BCFFF1|nr:hypothetical protein [Serratia fonticola]
MSTYEIIANAIKNKKQITATYKGHARELCPHAIGTKNGRQQALFYQFGGHSSSGAIVPGSPDNWKCLAINGLSNVSVHDGEWHTADNHSKAQTCVDWIDVEVKI